MTGDHLQRVLLEEANARCVVVRVDEVFREVRERAALPAAVADLLGEALAVTALCSSGVKFQGRVSLQLRSGGPLKLLMADCTDDGGMRGLARTDEEAGLSATGFADLVRGGVLTMTIEPSGRGRTWQGIVPLEGESMREAIENYFAQSEQLPTRLLLAVDGKRAAGVLLQRMPGEGDDEAWERVCHLLATLGPREMLSLDAETLLHRLFHEERRRLFPSRPLRFHCPCSRERVATVLRGLGREELESILAAEGEIEVHCEFCNQRYAFDEVDVRGLAQGSLPEMPDGGSTIH
ncbi:MAG: Hsp33 family molecular chaperone HslO [Wenzhouxiangellaceae bacterium]|nr:Hsp33 family molecular chaperone HslO [Wenzhouxiangellaceae bacterium]